MKRTNAIILLFSLLLVLLFTACTTSPSVSTYTAVMTEDDTLYTYTLTVDEKNETFSIAREPDSEYDYSGTFSFVNGYLILQSEKHGTQYARLLDDEFSFFTPAPETTNCTHDYVFQREVTGTCSSYGYKLYTCSKCGAEKKENTVKGDHNYVQSGHTPGTCRTKAVTVYTCSYCNATREIEGDYGNHDWVTDSTMEDKGCLVKKTVSRHCTVRGCGATEVAVVSDEYGSHDYDDNGVCRYCLYDKNGLCYTHTDADGDGECDDCRMDVEALTHIRQDGYYYKEGILYFGAYPTDKSAYSPEVIRSEGKYDATTGYYRYKNASYSVATKYNMSTKQNETEAYLVTYLTWKPVSSSATQTSFVCTSVVRFKRFIENVFSLSDGYHVDDPTKAANDWMSSDLFTFANTEFLLQTFNEKQRDLFFGSPVVDIPSATLAESLRKATYTDFSKFDLYENPTGYFYTKTPGENRTTTKCLHIRNDKVIDGGCLILGYGFLPFVTLNLVIE